LKLPKTTIAERAFDCLDAPIVRVAAPDVPAIPAAEALEQFYMPNLDKIVVALNRVLQY
jgi:2-oxoisovalerate dehydrogenase E1 component beta subunit